MSQKTCPGWEKFVQELENAAGPEGKNKDSNLTRRADRAVQRLALAGTLEPACRTALNLKEDAEIPAQTLSLAKTNWPLVITTNYDDLFLRAFANARPPRQRSRRIEMQVVGRDTDDCRAVLQSLDMQLPPMLWAVQGFLGSKVRQDQKSERLARQIVVGHHQYQRVINEDWLFRRAFAEVFRRRSFLFLGSGLTEDYFVNLFSEILHGFGPGPHPHFALMAEQDAPDPEFLLTRLNVNVVTYKTHDQLPLRLEELYAATARDRLHSGANASHASTVSRTFALRSTCNVVIEASQVPRPSDKPKECFVVSLGRSGEQVLHAGDSVKAVLPGVSADGGGFAPVPGSKYTYRFGDGAVYGVAATTDGMERDLRAVRKATQELLRVVQSHGFEVVHFSLLAAGPRSPWSAVFSLTQMLRALHDEPVGGLRSVIFHVVDHSVLSALEAGHVPVQELLSCGDLRFWVEIDAGRKGPSQRFLCVLPGDSTLDSVAKLAGVPTDWVAAALPAPNAEEPTGTQAIAGAQFTKVALDGVGVMPGGTLRFFPADAPPDGYAGYVTRHA